MARPSWRDWWKAPWWLVSLATGAKSFRDNPLIGSASLNRRGLHAGRVRLAHAVASRRRRRLAGRVDPQFRSAFDRDGFAVVPNALDDATRAEVDALLRRPLPTRAQVQGDSITRRVALTPKLLRSAPRLAALLRSPEWRGRLAYAAGSSAEPLYYLQTIVGGAADGPEDPQTELHSDSFHPSAKAWLFLTDVAPDGRPLTYVRGSHRLTGQRLEWERARSLTVVDGGDPLSQRGSLRFGTDDLRQLGLDEPVALAVPANTLVVADTFGVHARARSDRPTLRVELWAFSRPSPFLSLSHLSPLGLAPFVRRREDWLDRLREWLFDRGMTRHYWPSIGDKPPIEP